MRIPTLAASVALLVVASGCGSSGPHTRGGSSTESTTAVLASPTAVLTSISELSRFAAAWRTAAERGDVSVGGPVTILAPDNASMASRWESDPEGAILAVRCHLIFGSYLAEDLVRLAPTKLIGPGGEVNAAVSNGTVIFDRGSTTVRLVGADFEALGAIIHMVDGTLSC